MTSTNSAGCDRESVYDSHKNIRRHVLNILPAALINLAVGACLGWTAPAIVYYTSNKSEFSITSSDISWIASSLFITEIITPIILTSFRNSLGRKPLFIFSGLFLMLSWTIVLLSNSVHLIILSRALIGIAAAVVDLTWSIYVGEITGPSQRGIFGSVMVSMLIGGMTGEFLLSLFVPFVYLGAIPLAISVTGFVGAFFMREAPQFLLMRDKPDRAIENLAWLRATDKRSVQQEFEEIKHHVEEEKNSPRNITHFFQHTSEYKVYIMCVVIFSFAQLSGHIIIISYGALVMERYNTILGGNNLPFVYGLLQFIFVNLSPFLIETLGRRILLIFGFTAAGTIQATITILFYLDECKIVNVPYTPEIIIILFNLYGIVFVVCLLPSVYVMKSELFPQELKMIGSVAATIFNASSEFVIMKIFLTIWINFGLYVNFAIYAVVSLLSVIYIYVLIPETKGQSLVQIQKNISANAVKNRDKEVSS